MLALSGPAHIVCPLPECVKDKLVYNCAKLILRVLYKGHAFLKSVFMAQQSPLICVLKLVFDITVNRVVVVNRFDTYSPLHILQSEPKGVLWKYHDMALSMRFPERQFHLVQFVILLRLEATSHSALMFGKEKHITIFSCSFLKAKNIALLLLTSTLVP